MPGSKDKGSVKGSPQKKEKVRRYIHRSSKSTKSKQQKKIEEDQIGILDSLAESSTPVKPKPRSKKQSQRSESATSPSKKVISPGSESGITASIVVTETKKKEL